MCKTPKAAESRNGLAKFQCSAILAATQTLALAVKKTGPASQWRFERKPRSELLKLLYPRFLTPNFFTPLKVLPTFGESNLSGTNHLG